MEAANIDPDALLCEIARLQKRPSDHYKGRCTESFAWWVHGIQYEIHSLDLERKVREMLEESQELVENIKRLQPDEAGFFQRGYVSEYQKPHRNYIDSRTKDNKCLAALQRTCLVIIAETFHRRYEGRDIFSEEEFCECESLQSRLGEVVSRLNGYMSEFARSEDSTHLIRDLAQIELEYYRNGPTREQPSAQRLQ